MSLKLRDPDLQIEFAAALAEIRGKFLQQALLETIKSLDIPSIDRELAEHVTSHSLATLAAHGLRGELVFPVPAVLTANPCLIAYYRLLYGYSQKEFYKGATGFGPFKGMEERGVISKGISDRIVEICEVLCNAGTMLLAGIGVSQIGPNFLDDLCLLTLGPQFRGGANVRKGTAGIRTVFNVIHEILVEHVVKLDPTVIEIRNAAERAVSIVFASDPDIIVYERMNSGNVRELIAIEVKAGSDFSNIHNRIGEAEKSHQKARANGYSECWTVVNVDNIDLELAHRESPTTKRFYRISDLVAANGAAYDDFRSRIISLTGIRA